MFATPKPILVLLMAVSLLCSFSVTPCTRAFAAEPQITASGRALRNMLDSMGVEELWLAGHHVNWKTGLPDGRPYLKEGAHTHCSAFVAAVAYRLGIYILRPPKHPQTLLANAQVDWLGAEGRSRGWQEVESGEQAQELTNEGLLVVAGYKAHNPTKSGHIVVVRPHAKDKKCCAKKVHRQSRRRRTTSQAQASGAGSDIIAGHSSAANFAFLLTPYQPLVSMNFDPFNERRNRTRVIF